MQLTKIKRKWERKNAWGKDGYISNPYYRSAQWRTLRDQHRQGFTLVNGNELSNIFCIQCYRNHNRLVHGDQCDHIIARKDGGQDELSNLQTLCSTCHAIKSNNERESRIKNKIKFGL